VDNAAPDRSDSLSEQTDVHTLVEGEEQLPESIEDVVVAEEAAAREATPDAPGVEAWLFREDAEPRQATLAELPDLAADDAGFVWVDLDGYSQDDLAVVARRLDLPQEAVDVSLAGWRRPRLGVFGDRFFVTVTIPRVDLAAYLVAAGELDVFVGRNYLVSAHKESLPFAQPVFARAVQNPALLKLDSAFLLSILIDELLAYYEELTEQLEDAVEAIEQRALTDSSDALLEDLLRLKRVVFAVYRLGSQHRATFKAFSRPDFPFVAGDAVEPYFRDLDERLSQVLDALAGVKESVNGAFGIYVSQVSHRTNEIMKVLTIASVTLLPASVILGFFGTGFENPRVNTFAGFVAMLALIVLATAGSLLLFARRGWLRRG
jgi:magnesium transporter